MIILIILYIKLVTKQYKDIDFKISTLKSIMFNDESILSVAFDPDSVPGWDRDQNGFHTEEVNIIMVIICKFL